MCTVSGENITRTCVLDWRDILSFQCNYLVKCCPLLIYLISTFTSVYFGHVFTRILAEEGMALGSYFVALYKAQL